MTATMETQLTRPRADALLRYLEMNEPGREEPPPLAARDGLNASQPTPQYVERRAVADLAVRLKRVAAKVAATAAFAATGAGAKAAATVEATATWSDPW